jgi:NAD+ synthase
MITNVQAVASLLEEAIREFTDVAVVGTSGGVDSSVVASICVSALGPKSVYLVSMPYDENDGKTFNARSKVLADNLKANHLVVAITDAANSILSSISAAIDNNKDTIFTPKFHLLTNGNTRARMRMSVLYALAGEITFKTSKRGRVIGTGNASEDLIGYDTKGGDALADLFVIGDLFKSEVYQLATHYGVPKEIIDAEPSAGFYIGQTDKNELGYTYEELEPALNSLHKVINRGVMDPEIKDSLKEFNNVSKDTAQFVINRFLANAHKHRAPKVVEVRNSEYISK